ncbi:MAG: alpha-amylase [Bacteroidetes bacterium]|nr:MAG: alpha-amylase [Bacteroidota bacterium]
MKQNHRIWLLLSLILPVMAWAQPVTLERVDPPFWWAGMENPRLQLLLHGDRLAGTTVQLAYPGIEVEGVSRVENPNYLFIDLYLDPEKVVPGTFSIHLQRGRQQVSVQYEIKARPQDPNRIQGLDPSDLIYLLMPDRFANGDPDNDHVPGMIQAEVNREEQYGRHGGDIQGVMDHLDYLQDLGITTLWLNPAEENNQPHESYHGYAVTDHYRIDPRLGSNELMLQLVEQCHARGMKVIRDVVYNHVGDQHYFIKDLPMPGWVHQWESFTKTSYRAPTLMDPYASAYDRKRMADGWFDTHMPDLNQDNPKVATYLIQNSIWWIEYAGFDGYRIDTYAYPDQAFMARWAEAILQEYPGFTFFGETWVHGVPVQAWFTENMKGKALDSHMPGVTDFQLYYALNDALNQPFGWTEGVNRLYYTLAKDFLYTDPNSNVIFLDNHDVSRFYSVVGEDLNKYKMGVGFLLTTRGIPQVYYGTEILMSNLFDASNHDKVREEFPGGWPGDPANKFEASGRTAEEQEAFTFFRTLARFRRESAALTAGKLMQFVPDEGVYTYFRYHPKQTVMVMMNQNEAASQVVTDRFAERMQGFKQARDVISGETLSDLDQIEVRGTGIRILELQR